MITDNISKFRYFRILKAVYLLLGPACNMSCRHCSQTPIKNTFSLKPSDELNKNIISFLKEWSIVPPIYYKRIYFWGGEPLLYWKTIKHYILLFEKLGIKITNYRIYSNGLLLNDEIADFCNKHNIIFTMSYDAPNPLAIRNNIPNDDNIKSFLKIKNRNINFVFSALNDDISKAYDILEEIFPNTKISMGYIGVFFKNTPKDVYTFKEGQIENSFKKLSNDIINDNDTYHNKYRLMVGNFIKYDKFKKYKFELEPWPPCAPGLISLSLKFNGDIVRCHNDNIVISNISDNYKTIITNHLNEWKRLLPKICLDCDVLPMCRNLCPISAFDENKQQYIQCEHISKIWKSIIECRKTLTENDINPPKIQLYKDI